MTDQQHDKSSEALAAELLSIAVSNIDLMAAERETCKQAAARLTRSGTQRTECCGSRLTSAHGLPCDDCPGICIGVRTDCPLCGVSPETAKYCPPEVECPVRSIDANPLQNNVEQRRQQTCCMDCGRKYGDEHGFPDLVVPNDAWKSISPTGDEDGLLCPSCICRRAHDAGVQCEARFTSGPFCTQSASVPTQAMVDAINALPGWSGFDMGDLKQLLDAIAGAQAGACPGVGSIPSVPSTIAHSDPDESDRDCLRAMTDGRCAFPHCMCPVRTLTSDDAEFGMTEHRAPQSSVVPLKRSVAAFGDWLDECAISGHDRRQIMDFVIEQYHLIEQLEARSAAVPSSVVPTDEHVEATVMEFLSKVLTVKQITENEERINALFADLKAAPSATRDRDAERGRWMLRNCAWHRGHELGDYIAVFVTHGTDLSCVAMREKAIDDAMAAVDSSAKETK